MVSRGVIECVDAEPAGDTPHAAMPGRDRCEVHQRHYEAWQSANRQRRRRGSAKAPAPYQPRPRNRRFVGRELTGQQVLSIRAAVASVAITKAPIDTAIGTGAARISTDDVRPLLGAINELLESLGDLARQN